VKLHPIRIDGMRGRLAVWVAGVVVVTAAVIFVVVYRETGIRLRAEIDRDVAGDAMQLAHTLGQPQHQSPQQLLTAARSYTRAQPYAQASALLFVIVPGVGTASNHPELFGPQAPDDSEPPASQSQENTLGHRLAIPHAGYSTLELPDVGKVRLYQARVVTGGHLAYAGAGETLAIVSRSQADVVRSFALAGALALLLALIASYLVGARVSAPLRRLAGLAARVDAGDLQPRMHVDQGSTREVRVLAEAFNHMLDRLSEAFAAQRKFVADASHELRTPLTVMRGQLELLAAEENPSRQELTRVERLVQTEIGHVSRLVDDLLLLAQSERRDFLRVRSIDLRAFIGELWEGISLTADRDFQLGPVPPATLLADPDRLTQALRNLARNAIEHTAPHSGLVRLEVELVDTSSVRFAVIDDGPGIPSEERDRIFERFHRTDSSRNRSAGGTGLGLAIVRAIVDAHQGSVRARSSRDGGAEVEIILPGVAASRQPPAPVPSTRMA
jgi:two-component system, OmpR family, sensor kinase